MPTEFTGPWPEPLPVPLPPVTDCSQGTCVDVQVTDDGTGVRVTSTIEGNDGEVVFTRDEWDRFVSDVRHTGKWDHTHTGRELPSA